MIRHLVFLKVQPGHAARKQELVDRLNALNGKVPTLIALDAGLDVIHSDASWDIGLNSTFKDLDALEAYRVHPEHQAVVAIIKEICSARAVVDFNTAG